MPSKPSESDRDVLWQAANAFRTTQTLYVVAKLGIADLLRDRPKTSEELAQGAKAHPRSLFASCATSPASASSRRTSRTDSA